MSTNRMKEKLAEAGMTHEEVEAIVNEANKRFGELALFLAPNAMLQLMKSEDPIKAIASIHLSFVCLLFKNDLIMFKDKKGEKDGKD